MNFITLLIVGGMDLLQSSSEGELDDFDDPGYVPSASSSNPPSSDSSSSSGSSGSSSSNSSASDMSDATISDDDSEWLHTNILRGYDGAIIATTHNNDDMLRASQDSAPSSSNDESGDDEASGDDWPSMDPSMFSPAVRHRIRAAMAGEGTSACAGADAESKAGTPTTSSPSADPNASPAAAVAHPPLHRTVSGQIIISRNDPRPEMVIDPAEAHCARIATVLFRSATLSACFTKGSNNLVVAAVVAWLDADPAVAQPVFVE